MLDVGLTPRPPDVPISDPSDTLDPSLPEVPVQPRVIDGLGLLRPQGKVLLPLRTVFVITSRVRETHYPNYYPVPNPSDTRTSWFRKSLGSWFVNITAIVFREESIEDRDTKI